EVCGWAPWDAFAKRMSTAPPSCVTGACVLRMNAVTSTTTASFGSEGNALASFGAMSTTTSSLNAPTGQLMLVRPSELCSSSAAKDVAFFSTAGGSPSPPAGGTQIVKCDKM